MSHAGAAKLAQCLLVLLVALTFGRLVSAEFTNWDDPHTVRDNPRLRDVTVRSIVDGWRLFPPGLAEQERVVANESGLWIPLTYTVWSVVALAARVATAGGTELNPYLFHLANVGLHAIAVLLVFAVLRALHFRVVSAAIGSAVFALHPVQVEAVAWVSGMKDLLAGTLSLAAIRFYLAETSCGNRRRRAAAWAGFGCFILAMLAKPSAMTTPAILLVIEGLFIKQTWRVVAMSLLPWFVAAIPIGLIARAAQPGVDVPTVALHLRPLVAADALAFYLAKLALPLTLTIDYARTPLRILANGEIAWTWIVPAAALAIAATAYSKRRAVAPLAALLIMAAALAPVFGWLPFSFQFYSTTADHYLYVAMLGPAIACAAIFETCRNRPAYVLAATVLAAFSVRSIIQAGVWSDSRRLFEHAVHAQPASSASWSNLGATLSAAGKYDRAADCFRRSLQINVLDWVTQRNLWQVLTAQHRYDEALGELRRELRLRALMPVSRMPRAWLNPAWKGMAFLDREDFASAVSELRIVVDEYPTDFDARALLALAEGLSVPRSVTSRSFQQAGIDDARN